MPTTKTYHQYCGLARSLDVIGDRWSLLIVRELLPGARRFRDLHAALAGVATNLLTERLRRLESDGVVERQLGPEGVAVYALTPWGQELRAPIEALVRWSAPVMATGIDPEDSFDLRWLTVALPSLLAGRRSNRVVEVGLEVRGQRATVRLDRSGAEVLLDPAERPDTVVSGEPDVVLGLMAGMLPLDHPDLTVEGDPATVDRLLSGAAT